MSWIEEQEELHNKRWSQYSECMPRFIAGRPFSKSFQNTIFIDFELAEKDVLERTLYGSSFFKQHLNKVEMEVLNRLKELRNNNPDLKEILETKFPEIIDNTPFIYSGTIFMKKEYPKNLYTLLYKNDEFFIKNIKNNIQSTYTCLATNDNLSKIEKAYLNKNDFNKLLKLSATKLSNIAILSSKDLNFIHKSLFNN